MQLILPFRLLSLVVVVGAMCENKLRLINQPETRKLLFVVAENKLVREI